MGRQFVIRVKCVAHKLPLVENGALFPFERGKVSGEYVLDKNGLRCVKEGEDGLKCDFTIFAGWEDGPRASWWGDAPIPSIETERVADSHSCDKNNLCRDCAGDGL